MLREAIKEARSKYEIYFVGNELWVAYGQGSGTTSYMPDIKRALNNKSGDERYDSNVDKIVGNLKFQKPLKVNKDKDIFLYAIPFYPNTSGRFDVWGGDVKPLKNYYMVVSTSGVAVINIFDKKAEAMAWMRSV